MKGGRVAIDEVAAFLDGMNIPVNPEMLKDVISHSYADSNHTVDIGDVIFALDELQQQYEDVPITDEATSSKRLSDIPGNHLQPRKKGSSVSRLSDPITSKKLSLLRSKSTEKHDEPEVKQSKTSLQIRRLSSGVDSDKVGFQKPYPKIQDSKSKPPIPRSTTSLDKLPDKSDSSTVSKLERLAVREQLSPLKPVSSKERAAVSALESTHDAIHKLQGSYISSEELQSILPA
ncbi:EF-hand calcium-binding domain-containing protein 13, partial [Lemmus lemmus]